jgi:hypothetical protein
MFNKASTVSDGATNHRAKLSTAKSIGFRPGPELREEVDRLCNTSGWTTTDIARVGLQAFWPDIKALVEANPGKPPKKADEIRELRKFIDLCRSAQKRGVDPQKTLTDALESQLRVDAAGAATVAA